MNPLQWALLPLRRYADFHGRSTRAEYWWFIAFAVPLAIALLLLIPPDERGSEPTLGESLIIIAIVGIWLGLVIPALALQVRRLHDIDMSGWNVLWQFLPYIGPFILFYFMVSDGTVGDNRFGADPKGRPPPTLASLFD